VALVRGPMNDGMGGGGSCGPRGLMPDMGSSISGFGIKPGSWPAHIGCSLCCGN